MIAIVGKIASGKTRILNYLKRKGHKVLDVDRFIVKLYKSKQFALLVSKTINPKLVVNQKVDKSRIKIELTSQSKIWKIFENLVHNVIFHHLETHYYHFVEIPILFKMPLRVGKLFNEIWYLKIDENTRRNYLKLKKIDPVILPILENENNCDWERFGDFFNGIKLVNISMKKYVKIQKKLLYDCKCQINK